MFDKGSIIDSETFKLPLDPKRSLICLFCRNRVEEVTTYIELLKSDHVVLLLDGLLQHPFKQELVKKYCPRVIFDASSLAYEGYREEPFLPSLSVYRLQTPKEFALHPSLKLLLATSGTTGNPKLIRLSKKNILSNAEAIVTYLGITKEERAIASLPIHYSYGLSVLHSHLLAGAQIVFTQESVAQSGFWDVVRKYSCTSMAGVPYTYQILDRIGFEKMDIPSLRTLTQAGGRLDPALVVKFHEIMQKRQGQFYVMYGQTEATARIAYLPPKYLPEKATSIGIAIPGGKIELSSEGELVYYGQNVMLGYAEGIVDLARGDDQHGVLHTGDIGYVDEEGLFYLTGRIKRIAKLYGLRINLDDIEKEAQGFGTVAAVSSDNTILLYFEQPERGAMEACKKHLAAYLQLHASFFECISCDRLPRTSGGKINYQLLCTHTI